ncbi:MAG TPA: peptidylprolyl isomerase [Muribaculum sp.]|uniref:Peptidylprolyl isomerase n=1 Tax=Heminiphilus faecis TaxID=2601703 RepID=A0ABV4CYC1_9BACT|nr:peptidylprolyl isomerase [Heminiphilus faecis]RLT76242.1 peptidylprolyl isomerase [bacterium J10(2018)]HRF68560.1 peptidylprolyl isomerase [Muribaculum sp.]
MTMASMAQNNIVEEVVWWIGDEPIYKSEVEEMYQTMLYEHNEIDGNPYCVIPEQLAIEKLFLHQAELDSVTVQDAMVMQEVDRRINYMITNLGTQEKVEQFYRRPMPEIRETMVDAIRNTYKVREVQNSLTKDLKITPSDVRKYFSQLPADSIPFVPLQVEVQIMTLNPVIPREEIDEVKSRLRDIADKVNKGETEFSTQAIFYSQDPGTSMRGGEVGFMGRGHLEPEYAAVAFNLNDPKKVSKIVETQFGYHIIQLIEKRGDRINTRHILMRPKVTDKDLTEALHRLDTVRSEIMGEKYTFEEAVPYVSQDKDTRNSRGVMVNDNNGTTRFEMADLPQEVSKAVNTMSVGELSKPFIMKEPKRNRDIVAIVKLTNRIEGHRANLSDDYQMIKGMYENSIKEKMVSEWIEKKIKDTYVRIEDGWRDCDFKHEGWIKKSN